ITGGLGGLGTAVASWLSVQGARRIVLVGRRIPEGWSAPAASITVREGDASDVALLSSILDDMEDLQGVIHAAGALADAPILEQNEETARTVLGPKIGGALALDRATRGLSLEYFVL